MAPESTYEKHYSSKSREHSVGIIKHAEKFTPLDLPAKVAEYVTSNKNLFWWRFLMKKNPALRDISLPTGDLNPTCVIVKSHLSFHFSLFMRIPLVKFSLLQKSFLHFSLNKYVSLVALKCAGNIKSTLGGK